ncbi:protein aurora borealis [Diachasma alloeum]|uniref:protein aurora borealis n=1 Tax=Diachasma alloeum TaxID=454923 RepID=UPI00073834D0|nr:protein aurora borealis [Diachasma alloeum]
MERMQLTPCKTVEEHAPASPRSPHKTPSRQDVGKDRHTTYHATATGFTLIPNHMTPPSGITRFMARNPFDADLTNRLHLSVISPTIFSKVSPKMQGSPAFAWTIDELAIMTPAMIDEFPVQQNHCTDPEVEIHAQKAIDKFFSEPQIHPSPWNLRKETQPLMVMTPTTRPVEALGTSRVSPIGMKDCATQTVLTLPPVLPKDLEEALKPYFTFTQDQSTPPDTDDANSSNNSLRRKLFFTHDESSEDEDDGPFVLSPLKSTSSPPQSGMFVHGTPLRGRPYSMQRNHGTPYTNSKNLSPLNMSPICNPTLDMSCQSIQSRRRSVARLDFTTFMSIDVSSSEEKDAQQTPTSTHPETIFEESLESKRPEDQVNKNDTIEMVSLLQESTPFNPAIPITIEVSKIDRVKETVDWYRNTSSESLGGQKHGNTLIRSNYSEQSSAFNFAQDTGYQTYSMNNTSDNRSITPLKKQNNWSERITAISEIDEVKSTNWQENIENMYSSTPSKYGRQRNN